MSIGYWFLIGIIVFIIIMVLLLVFDVYTPYKPTKNTGEDMNNIAAQIKTINYPWSAATPVDGLNGQCNVYTFVSNDKYMPAIVSYSDINSCNSGCQGLNCSCSTPTVDQTCVDVDQLFAQQVVHTCKQLNTDLRNSGMCLQQNGQLVNPGTVETFYSVCQTSTTSPVSGGSGETQTTSSQNNNYCTGELSILAFNIKQAGLGEEIFDNAVCMSTPNYVANNVNGKITYNNLTPMYAYECDLSATYNNIPSQLFRIVKASYDGANFKENQYGNYFRIVHRPTGYYVYPSFETGFTNPIAGSLQIVKPADSLPNKGYTWFVAPPLTSPAGDLMSLTQLIYIQDVKTFPYPITWDYAINTISVQPSYNVSGSSSLTYTPINGGILNAAGYVIAASGGSSTADLNSVNQATVSEVSIFNYSILPTLLQKS